MATTVLPVPTILNILNDSNSNYFVDQNVESPGPRAKKRRLDHLSWEEKIQRKKLKNRVAAQTSRDRKKAKLDQMETAIQQLFIKNETIIAECEKLREANERLQAENAELNQRLQKNTMQCCQCQNRPVVCAPESGSTERNERLHSSGFGQDQRAQGSTNETNSSLPSLPDLLDELETDTEVDLNALEQLTQTLLEDIARDLESAAQTATNQESTPSAEDNSGEMVGSSSKQLESSGDEVLKKEKVEHDISEYLLLHHNYAKTQPKEVIPPRRKTPTVTRKLKTIRPKIHSNVKSNKIAVKNNLSVQPDNIVLSQDKSSNNDVLYGTFDENTNTITILVNEDSIPSINEVVIGEPIVTSPKCTSQDINIPLNIDTSNCLSVSSPSVGSSSPKSDLGYESLDSPLSCSDMETWDQSVSELFPALF